MAEREGLSHYIRRTGTHSLRSPAYFRLPFVGSRTLSSRVQIPISTIHYNKTLHKGGLCCNGGERGIRTLGTLWTHTRFPIVRLRPLGHLSSRCVYSYRKNLYLQAFIYRYKKEHFCQVLFIEYP